MLVTLSYEYKFFLDELRKLLLQNGYRSGVFNYNVNDVLNRQENRSKQPTITFPKKEVLLILPYLWIQSRILAKHVKACINKFYGFFDLRVVSPRARIVLSLLFPTKTVSPVLKCPGLLIRLVVRTARRSTWVLKTKRRLHDRKTEHFKSITSSNHSSAIADPCHVNWS